MGWFPFTWKRPASAGPAGPPPGPTVFDGFANAPAKPTAPLPVSGIPTPTTGAVNGQVGFVGDDDNPGRYRGDRAGQIATNNKVVGRKACSVVGPGTAIREEETVPRPRLAGAVAPGAL
jgi:hypothetical protein